ncbi:MULTISPECIES: polysaccharide deacetylase family protein [unclassified Lysobacter]|uniref:polysaccharide deacetylase family protein n=1 Tax=unclassified Lysobacter TaxID=2635362 RepID=UPI001C212A53|nr:polysaccharide deacetylase family protein [Lysobacter sp. MMG2]MBU8976236.1 polysaccharide deacetylase family protein [Lysobacter sp. MMG2]
MYHNLCVPPRDIQRQRGLYVTPQRFARQMSLLRSFGYRGVSMSEAMPYLRGEQHGRIAVITFDDGYRDNLDNALPVLRALGFTATCYVVSSWIGGHNAWDCDRLGLRKPLMSVHELRQWQHAGMEVGAHTRTHPRLGDCDALELKDQIGGSRAFLEDLLGRRVTQFCYPYGDHDDAVVAATREAGFDAAVTTQRGRARRGDDLWRLPRVPITFRHLLPSFALRTLTGYEDRNGRDFKYA